MFPGDLLNFNPMSFDINLVTSLGQSFYSLRSQQSVMIFPPENQLKFLGYDRLVFIRLCQLFIVNRNWNPKPKTQNFYLEHGE